MSSARAVARGLMSQSWGVGRRLMARGSMRLGRLPTICEAKSVRRRSIKRLSSRELTAASSQVLAKNCSAVQKLSWRGERSAMKRERCQEPEAGKVSKRERKAGKGGGKGVRGGKGEAGKVSGTV